MTWTQTNWDCNIWFQFIYVECVENQADECHPEGKSRVSHHLKLGHRPPSWKRRMCTQSKKKDCGVPSIKCRPTFSNRSPQCPRSLIGWNIKRKSILRAKACSCQSHTHTSTLQTENQEKEDAERAKRVEMFGWAVFRMIWNNLSPAGVRSGSR